MKKAIQLSILLSSILLIGSCKKSGTAGPSSPGQAACKLLTETTTLPGNNATYEYTYNAAGKITLIKKRFGGAVYDSILVGDNTTVDYHVSNSTGFTNIFTTVYNRSFVDGMPTEAQVAFQEGAVTHTDVNHFFFFYDNKNRLSKVGQQTDNVIGDFEYDLTIHYNDQDNVISLSYENTTGPVGVYTIGTSGYDNKPNPFAGIKNWCFFMHAAWNNYDPEPIFTALSKNNLLGYTMPDGFKREMTFSYNDKNFPTIRTNKNTTSAGSTATFIETFNYQCQ